jgi:hypothetical protein
MYYMVVARLRISRALGSSRFMYERRGGVKDNGLLASCLRAAMVEKRKVPKDSIRERLDGLIQSISWPAQEGIPNDWGTPHKARGCERVET